MLKCNVQSNTYKAESVCSLFPETGHSLQQIWTKFAMRHPYIQRTVISVEFYL